MARTTLKLDKEKTAEVVQNLLVSHPKLWDLDFPYRYTVETIIKKGGKTIDKYLTPFGIRSVKFDKDKGFFLNNKHLKLKGMCLHQDAGCLGTAVPDRAYERRLLILKEFGTNAIRCSHNPPSPEFLNYCDSIGFLVIDEAFDKWKSGYYEEFFDSSWQQDISDMVIRDRNHPSVIMWETTLNESWPPKSWKDQAVRIAHEEFPGDQCYTSGDTYGYDGFDVCYNDWKEGYNRPNTTSKPGFIREYYDYEFGGHYSTTRVTRGDGDYALMQNAWNAQWSYNRYRAYYPWTIGGAVWSMYDYNRGCCDNICYSGLADLFRLPKFGLLYFRTQMKEGTFTPAGPMTYEVFINSHWLEGSSDTLQVYGNVDEVKLQLNGRVIARQYPDDKPSTSEYVSRPDGGNAENIDFPPFTFFNVNWERGELKAIGYKDGKTVAEHVVRTPGAVEAMDITYFESGVSASCRDLLIVYVNLKDLQGTGCFGENNREVKLEVLQGGELRGPATIKAEAGVASFLVATTDSPMLVLKAVSGNLETMRKLKLKK